MKPSLRGKVAIVTGANTGIGRITAIELARQGVKVFLACRSESKTRPVLEEIGRLTGDVERAQFLSLDLGDLKSVQHAAQVFLSTGLPLHILVCNAGLAGQKGMTSSGFELAFGTCHVGHFLLTKLLLECLKASAPARVVVVSSKAHRHAKDIDFAALRQTTASTGGLKEYAVAKLANLLFVSELANRLKGTGVDVYALHPGVVASDVWRSVPALLRVLIRPFMITPEQGAATSLWCATAPELCGQSGGYYENCRVQTPSDVALDQNLAVRLWQSSEDWTALLQQ
ncbi:MAG: SDR family oxidoreductase [Thalassobium sp.]|nr:MAG: SDR family oxidoreductase [Thalassobium sp.]PIQ40532.1 MAG: SDR family oxidoreductase [Thalassolituus sp. CG17_big_fil_post_rev_8_21_14_2_50_53_8]